MLHIWLLPALFLLVLAVAGLYLLVSRTGGGDGTRKDGQCVCDYGDPEPDDPP